MIWWSTRRHNFSSKYSLLLRARCDGSVLHTITLADITLGKELAVLPYIHISKSISYYCIAIFPRGALRWCPLMCRPCSVRSRDGGIYTLPCSVRSRGTWSALARVASVWKVTMTSFCVIRLSGLGVHLMSVYARLSFQLNTQLYTSALKNII